MLSQELEFCLNDAFAKAREARHEFLTVEHLLLSILDTPKVREILLQGSGDQEMTFKLVNDVAPRYADRNGGYLRILKLGPRQGDNAQMARIELV